MTVTNWKTIYYQNTQQTGRAVAIEAVAADLEAKGIDYEVVELGNIEVAEGVDLDTLLEGEG